MTQIASEVTRPLVEMRGIVKRFPGVLANASVDLEVRRGEIHALLGENGAGKTTLMHILSGLYQPDDGEILVDGEAKTYHSPRDAIQAGIGMVHQHFSLVDVFSTAENIIVGLEHPRLHLNMREVEDKLAKMGRQYGLRVDPRARIWQLSVGEQQRVEILKMLYRDVRLLILDEPTAVLTPQEADELSKTLRQMAKSGRAVLYISHKLREVLEVSDRITVLRAGRNVATVRTEEVDQKRLTKLMIDEDVLPLPEADRNSGPQQVILDIRDLHVRNERGLEAIEGLSLRVREREILGLAGVAGNGQKELAEAIAGLRQVESGTIHMGDADVTHGSSVQLIEAGLSLIPEDRLGMGLIPDLGLHDNAMLKNYRKPPISRGPLLARNEIRRHAERLVNEFSVRVARLDEPVWKLSGGNLQRLLLGREISTGPRVMVAANPTRGLDVQATAEIQHILLKQRNEGAAILLISEDLDELLSISDRVAVIYEGRIVGETESSEAKIEELGLMMMGMKVGDS